MTILRNPFFILFINNNKKWTKSWGMMMIGNINKPKYTKKSSISYVFKSRYDQILNL